jgi:hypothetical protein
VDPPGIGDGASLEPSVLGGFLFAAPVFLWCDLDAGVGDALTVAGAVVVAVVPCCWQEAMKAMPTMAAMMDNRFLFIGC